MRQPLIARIRSKVSLSETGCWIWTGYVDPHGYGRIRVNRKSPQAHRVAYEAFIGPIPNGLQLDHLCRNRACVNPTHLEPVTQLENIRRGRGHGSETHCPRGHAYTAENLVKRARGDRDCKICHRERERLRWRRSRGLAC